jgi:hypothetical protein
MKYQIFRGLLAVLAIAMLHACGGGGGSDSNVVAGGTAPAPAPATGGGGPTITKVGAITGFGSVFVEGERFETSSDGTAIRKDDLDADEDDLEVGMVVRVRASSRNDEGEWVADDIEFDEDVKGPIDSIGASSLVVVGQTVNIIPGETHIDDGLTLIDLSAGEIVEVSGYRNALDEIDALFLERKNPGEVDEYEVLGQIRNLDTDNEQFEIGGLTVNYGLAELDDLDGGLSEGLLVEVEDENLAYMAGDLVMDATEVEGEDRFEFKDEDDNDEDNDDDGDDHDTEITSVITEILSSTAFMMGSIEVRHDSGTEFEGGTAEDLAVGVRVEAEGTLIGDNVLSAHEIEFELHESARLSGLVNEIDEGAQEVVVMGVTVRVAGAEMDDSLNDVEPFTLADLDEGNFVEVEGTETDNIIDASEFERDDADDDSEMRGLLDAFDPVAMTVTIFGKVIGTDSSTRYEIEDMTVSAETFFDRLHVDQSVVDVDWDGARADTLSPAKELSLED